MIIESAEVIELIEEIDRLNWDLAHDRAELASARSQLLALTASSQQLEKTYEQHKNESGSYISSLEQNVQEAKGWVETLEKKLYHLRPQRAVLKNIPSRKKLAGLNFLDKVKSVLRIFRHLLGKGPN
jgi:ERCC4-type nuclease